MEERLSLLTSKLVARGLILLPTSLKRINFHMHIALLMLTRVPSVCSANSAWRKIGKDVVSAVGIGRK